MIPVLFSDPGSGKSRNALWNSSVLVFSVPGLWRFLEKELFASSDKGLFLDYLDFISLSGCGKDEAARWPGEGQGEA